MREMTDGITRKDKNLSVGKQNTSEFKNFKHLYLTDFNEFELNNNKNKQNKILYPPSCS